MDTASRLQPWPVIVSGSLLALASSIWLKCVNLTVHEPYMDEFFHVRQALEYWSGQWRVWDPMITTPPGLYIVSWIGLYIGQFLSAQSRLCQLRSLNVLGIFLLFFTIYKLLVQKKQPSLSAAHTALNICLFPPLFFFSGLYYTDVISALTVLLAHQALQAEQPRKTAMWSIVSLWFRQTNIFWTAIYLGGLEVVRHIKKEIGHSNHNVDDASITEVAREAWRHDILYDLPVEEAYLGTYLKLLLSLALTSIKSIHRLAIPLAPYLTTLAAFGGFLCWNRGIVLGDKSHHIPALNLPQLLYIWPYIAFFSWPMLLPSLHSNLVSLIPTRSWTSVPRYLRPFSTPFHVRLPILIAASSFALAVIHFNTLMHPYTLADDRHYPFYVFRLLWQDGSLLKYFAAPVYVCSAWAIISAIVSTMTAIDPTTTTKAQQRVVPMSKLMLWLMTTVAALATAPLVEPRYYILPWIVWRLDIVGTIESVTPVGLDSTLAHIRNNELEPIETSFAYSLSAASLILETAWYLTVNAVTCWVFLYRPLSEQGRSAEVRRLMY